MLGFNDTSTLVGYFVYSPREREKRDSRRYEREDRKERETGVEVKKHNKNLPPILLPATRIAGLAQL